MTDRSSRSNEETPKWVQTVASIRGELMTRFSDRLSMEEIASCAYAVAMRDGRGRTGMVEEERSRFEKWAKGPHPRGLKFDLTRDLKGRPGYDQSDADAAWEGWQARSALEDRQEAAPQESFWVVEQFKDGVGGKYWAGDSSRDFVDDVEKAVQYRRKSDAWRATRGWHWTDIKHTEHLMLPPAGTPAKEAQTKCSYCGWGTGHAESCSYSKIAAILGGVPSEATPTKENAPLRRIAWLGKNIEIRETGESNGPRIRFITCNCDAPRIVGIPDFANVCWNCLPPDLQAKYPSSAPGKAEGEDGPKVSIDVFQRDWVPGFASFLDNGAIAEGAHAHVTLNLGSILAAVRTDKLDKHDLPYFIAESLMHEAIHCLESWAEVELQEKTKP